MPFDPHHLTPSASLNRIRIFALPSVPIEPEIVGKTASELLGARALADAVLHAEALRLDTDERAGPARLLPALDRRLEAGVPAIRAAAQALAHRFGRSLGYLLLTLKRGDEISRAARPDWDESYWAHWSGIHTVWLGGGIVGGRLGKYLTRHAAEVLAEGGVDDLRPRLAPFPSSLPLIGAARSLPPSSRAALVLDFGGSYVKRACALYDDPGALVALRSLAPLPAPTALPVSPDAPTPDEALRVAEDVAAILADSWGAASAFGYPLAPVVVASVACYVRGGHVLPRQLGTYAPLHALPEAAARWFSRRVSARVGHPVELSLVHDGTAAARSCASAEPGDANDVAAIMLGTAIGVGFPLTVHTLRPLAPTFAVLS
jgi:hypothetical protein